MFKSLWARIVMDYKEWRNHREVMWRLKREKKLVNMAIERAQIKNRSNGKTYYILRNRDGNPEEFIRDAINIHKEKTIVDIYKEAYAIVSSDETKIQHYTITHAKKEKL